MGSLPMPEPALCSSLNATLFEVYVGQRGPQLQEIIEEGAELWATTALCASLQKVARGKELGKTEGNPL